MNVTQTWQMFVRMICSEYAVGNMAVQRVRELLAAVLPSAAIEAVGPLPYDKLPGSCEVRLKADAPGVDVVFDSILAALGRGWDVRRADDEVTALLNVMGTASFVVKGVTWASFEATKISDAND